MEQTVWVPVCPERIGARGLFSFAERHLHRGSGPGAANGSQASPATPRPQPVLHKYLRSSCLADQAPRCLPGYRSLLCVCHRPGLRGLGIFSSCCITCSRSSPRAHQGLQPHQATCTCPSPRALRQAFTLTLSTWDALSLHPPLTCLWKSHLCFPHPSVQQPCHLAHACSTLSAWHRSCPCPGTRLTGGQAQSRQLRKCEWTRGK